MALGMSLLLSYLLLACVLNLANSQPIPVSVYRQLSARDLREISLRQNPELLELAARTGESVTVIIGAAEQGAIVQENVNTVLDCGPWLSNFPGGTVEWYFYQYNELDHITVGDRNRQDRMALNSGDSPRARILGDFNEIYNITRALISMDAEDSSRGIYECEVCIARGTPFEECHSANTTVATAGRPPIIRRGFGRIPVMDGVALDVYDIGSTICLQIDPFDATRNNPSSLARLQCADVLQDISRNIPTPLPPATFTWTHRSLTGIEADFAVERGPDELRNSMYMPPDEFIDAFPELIASNRLTVSTDAVPATSSLDFSTNNITKNFSDPTYLALRQAFGIWTCTMNNSLGMETATTFITDMCGMDVPSIVGDCSEIGTVISGNLALVERGQSVAIPAVCDACIQQAGELWLTLTCPTNEANFDDASVQSYRWTDENGRVLSERQVYLVQDPGSYTCTVDFGNAIIDSQTTTIGYVPDVQLSYSRDDTRTSGCDRLRTNATFAPNDVCAYVGEEIVVNCTSSQENVSATAIDMTSGASRSMFSAAIGNDEEIIVCDVTETNALVDGRCEGFISLMLTVYMPATILIDGDESCSASAGMEYNSVSANAPVVLCCDVVGFPDPAANWTRVVLNEDGVAVEVSVEVFGPDFMVDPEFNRLTILNYNATEDAGTYVCRAENIAGIDHATVTLSAFVIGTRWAVSEWSECEPNCVDGTRTRTVWCQTVPEGVVVADIMCDCDLKPASSERCTNVPGLLECFDRPLWKTGEFSACSRGCAGGVRYRPVYCASLLDGSRVDDNRCIELYGPDGMPPAYDICFNRCCVTDTYPHYCQNTGTGPCDNPIFQQYCCWTCHLTELP